ncbi:hypothetical protein SAMN04488553_1497 [Gramella sp. MAR_2010_147]|nr:hypothetical protein SAMN04488553_1497 [Gramella sp. MAR_2010_147]
MIWALRFALNRLAPGFRGSLPDKKKSGELKQTTLSLTQRNFLKLTIQTDFNFEILKIMG